MCTDEYATPTLKAVAGELLVRQKRTAVDCETFPFIKQTILFALAAEQSEDVRIVVSDVLAAFLGEMESHQWPEATRFVVETFLGEGSNVRVSVCLFRPPPPLYPPKLLR